MTRDLLRSTPPPPANFLPNALQVLLGYLVLRPWVAFCLRGRVRRSRTMPDGPCVLACNHRSYADPGLVGMFMHRPIAYFARADLWQFPVIAFFLNAMFGIPVDRENPGLSSMKGAVERLRRGIAVLVFPEGTRSKDGRLGTMREGPALFARRAGVPIVPVYLVRSEVLWPRGKKLPRFLANGVEVRFGTPLVPPPDLEPRAQDAWISRRLQLWMEAQERRLLGRR
ncbi:MAG: 1-acyl-sn-glycerol-3-phosphate acyltransferase [Planctomycetes bacterium]|nr:1-acyl-sn-glycerol-3-phosphate acyltransferase [Planctomycetota bacterium]